VDGDVLQSMVENRVGWVTTMFWVITTLGNTVSMFVWSIVGCVLLLRRGRRADAVVVAGAMLTAWGAMSLAKLIFGRARPPIPERLVEISSHSFPSGHATMSAVLATVAIAMMLRAERSAREIGSLRDDEEFVAHRGAADGVRAGVEGAEGTSVVATGTDLRNELHGLAFVYQWFRVTDITHRPR
jgi:hypothetical protein